MLKSKIGKMKNKLKQDLLRSYKLIIIFLLLFNVMMPIFFIWIVEISMKFIPGAYLTNGFVNVESIKIYHIIAWVMVFVSIMTSLFGLYYLEKIIYGKYERNI